MEELIGHAKLGPGGRIVIPAPIRRELGLEVGDDLTLRIVEGALKVISRKAALKRIQDRFQAHVPRGVSLADELIAERRREAASE